MEDEKNKGLFSKIFGKKKSSCCNIKIEEITDDEEKVNHNVEQKTEDKSKDNSSNCCSGGCCG